MDGINEFEFTPASEYKERHGLFIALVGGTNSGKSFSALRLATGIAKAQGKRVAVLDTEGGRILHLRKHFDFDFRQLEPPHRPQRYLQAAQSAQAKGYGCLVIDSFSMEWRGPGGKLEWNDEELEKFVARRKADAEAKGWNFDETKTRLAGKAAASIEPSMSHKAMEFGFLQLRMPIIFAIRGAMTYDPDQRKSVFKAQCRQDFLFDVTVSFRLAQDKKGIIDLTDAVGWKMEGDHATIFKDGEQLSERHGELVNAWATNAPLPDKATAITDALIERVTDAATEDALLNALTGETEAKQVEWLKAKRPELYKKLNDATEEKRRSFSGTSASTSTPHTVSDAEGGQAGTPPAAGADSQPEGAGQPATSVNWRVEAVGESAIIKGIKELIDTAPRVVDVDAILQQNSDRIGKMSAAKRADIEQCAKDRKADLNAADGNRSEEGDGRRIAP